MKIPQEWIDEASKRISEHQLPINERPSLFRVEKEIDDYINSDFNKNWTLNPYLYDAFKSYFIGAIVNNCNPMSHGLTCGVDSNHAALVPRITSLGAIYLVCPTCGYIQSIPNMPD
jgi:hypothetical protein